MWFCADFFEDELAQFAFIRNDFQLEWSVVDDFENDLSGEAGMDRRRCQMNHHAEAGLFAFSFDSGGELSLDRQRDTLKGPHKDELARLDDDDAVGVWRQRCGEIAKSREIDQIEADVVPGSGLKQALIPGSEIVVNAQVKRG